jgi:hypothetical protein
MQPMAGARFLKCRHAAAAGGKEESSAAVAGWQRAAEARKVSAKWIGRGGSHESRLRWKHNLKSKSRGVRSRPGRTADTFQPLTDSKNAGNILLSTADSLVSCTYSCLAMLRHFARPVPRSGTFFSGFCVKLLRHFMRILRVGAIPSHLSAVSAAGRFFFQ